MSKIIDATPTWSDVMPVLLAAAERGSDVARDEIKRLAAAVDHIASVDIGRKARDLVDEAQISATFPDEGDDLGGYMVLVPMAEWEALVTAVNSHAQEANA
jgi:hypothetical protein